MGTRVMVQTGWFRMACAIVVLQALGGCDFISAPEGEAQLNVRGVITNKTTGQPIPNATVAIDVGFIDRIRKTQQITGADGSYSLVAKIEHVATDKQFAGGCTVWKNDVTTDVSVTVVAAGYLPVYDDGRLKCIDAQQTINISLTPL
jgi:hypothetical protein